MDYSLLHAWNFPGKSTGVGCYLLLQLKKTDATTYPLSTQVLKQEGSLREKHGIVHPPTPATPHVPTPSLPTPTSELWLRDFA